MLLNIYFNTSIRKKHYLCRKFTNYVPVYTRHYYNGKELQPTGKRCFICAPDRIRDPTCRRFSRTLSKRQPTQADRQHNRQRRSTAHRRQPRYKSAYIQTENRVKINTPGTLQEVREATSQQEETEEERKKGRS